MNSSVETQEMAGVFGGSRGSVWIADHGGYAQLATQLSVANLTPNEMRCLARQLYRMARRIEARATSSNGGRNA